MRPGVRVLRRMFDHDCESTKTFLWLFCNYGGMSTKHALHDICELTLQ